MMGWAEGDRIGKGEGLDNPYVQLNIPVGRADGW
jgi:hypothetical protein